MLPARNATRSPGCTPARRASRPARPSQRRGELGVGHPHVVALHDADPVGEQPPGPGQEVERGERQLHPADVMRDEGLVRRTQGEPRAAAVGPHGEDLVDLVRPASKLRADAAM